MEYSIHRKKGKCYLFHFFDALLCNLTKLVNNILRNYAAREEKRFKRINKLILFFVMKML